MSLWYIKKNNWKKAHNIIQELSSKVSFWIHAHLHRIEGDNSNANYWYGRCFKNTSHLSINDEYDEILNYIFINNEN